MTTSDKCEPPSPSPPPATSGLQALPLGQDFLLRITTTTTMTITIRTTITPITIGTTGDEVSSFSSLPLSSFPLCLSAAVRKTN